MGGTRRVIAFSLVSPLASIVANALNLPDLIFYEATISVFRVFSVFVFTIS